MGAARPTAYITAPFPGTKVGEYCNCFRWGVSHRGLTEYLFVLTLHRSPIGHADGPLPFRGSLRMNLLVNGGPIRRQQMRRFL
jgi:hypothetical protein